MKVVVKPEEIEKEYKKCEADFVVFLASDTSRVDPNAFFFKIRSILNIIRHSRNQEKALETVRLMNCKPDCKDRARWFKSFDDPFVKGLSKKLLPKVGFKKIIYITRVAQNKWDAPSLSINGGPIRYRDAKKPNPAWTFCQNLKKGPCGPGERKIRVRVMAKQKINLFGEKESNRTCGLSWMSKKAPEFKPKNVIVYIHGGGYVGGSSYICQPFTRK
jgi:hypothetical protein